MIKPRPASTSTGTDQIGKLFRVLPGQARRCIVCDELFTAPEAARHSRVPCGPTVLCGAETIPSRHTSFVFAWDHNRSNGGQAY